MVHNMEFGPDIKHIGLILKAVQILNPKTQSIKTAK